MFVEVSSYGDSGAEWVLLSSSGVLGWGEMGKGAGFGGRLIDWKKELGGQLFLVFVGPRPPPPLLSLENPFL